MRKLHLAKFPILNSNRGSAPFFKETITKLFKKKKRCVGGSGRGKKNFSGTYFYYHKVTQKIITIGF